MAKVAVSTRASGAAAKPRNARKRAEAASNAPPLRKLDQLAALVAQGDGASIAEMTAATGWQAHSVRGALAGALKKRGLAIVSDKVDGVRRYRTTAGHQ